MTANLPPSTGRALDEQALDKAYTAFIQHERKAPKPYAIVSIQAAIIAYLSALPPAPDPAVVEAAITDCISAYSLAKSAQSVTAFHEYNASRAALLSLIRGTNG